MNAKGTCCCIHFINIGRTICGTPNYIAPEILSGANGHSYEVDVWAIGVILYTFLIGVPPFETSNVEATYKRIRANIYSFPDEIVVSDNAKHLIKAILHPIPGTTTLLCNH